jgi:TPP-dependent pyruvate/acetoin dehydrogenase alpha subunit
MSPPVPPDPSGPAAVPAAVLRRAHFLMRLSRAWDNRFEALARAGTIGRWYSAVGNEATTVGTALGMQPNDTLSTVHRDLGAVLSTYLDPTRLAPSLFTADEQTDWDRRRPEPKALLDAARLPGARAPRGLHPRGRSERFTTASSTPDGHPSHRHDLAPRVDDPRRRGRALSAVQDGADHLALGFIGEGATSQGDFHEAINLAGVMKLPLVLVVENNRYAFSTTAEEQYACARLSDRAAGYGIAGETVDGTDFDAVWAAMQRAAARARSGGGATLLECMLPRMRGHAEGDGSYELIDPELRAAFLQDDPCPAWRRPCSPPAPATRPASQRSRPSRPPPSRTRWNMRFAAPEPDLAEAWRNPFAPGAVADAFARQHAELRHG